jgi:diadenylate cyclase
MTELRNLIASMQWSDWLDIALVALLFYTLLMLLRRTRSTLALRGLVSVLLASVLLYFFSFLAGLSAMTFIFERFWLVAVIVFIVIFQNDFKAALVDLGQIRLFRVFFTTSREYIDEIASAVAQMSNRKIGALIAIERRSPLKVYADTGTPLDAAVTDEILRTIFTPYTPLHDGAVIIRNERIVAAGAILPLSESAPGKDLGTRHRAALGLSEETDAPVIVVSEETGIITMAFQGQLNRGLTPDDLKSTLFELMEAEGIE